MGEDYRFIPTDPEDIITWMTESYEALTGAAVQPASPEELFIRWMAEAIVFERVLTNYVANQNIPSRAVGDNLDALAELYYAKGRPGATAAECTMRFTISQPQSFAVLVPKGTRVTDARRTLVWETLADAYVNAGESYADVRARCQTAGTAGNGWAAGQIDAMMDPAAYIVSCENLAETDGGADEATDEEFRELLRLSMDAYSTAGASGAYIYHAKQVSTEIADVAANSTTPGVVKLYVLMEDGTPAGEEMKGRVLTACSADTVRPLTDLVEVEDPETVEYDITLTYYLRTGEGAASAAEVEKAVNEAVERYKAWQSAKLGRDINPDELREYLYHTGIKRVVLTAPEFQALRDGKDKTAPQVAKARTVTVTSGGYEDE